MTTFRWWNGQVERVEVYRIQAGKAYVSWPDSQRDHATLGLVRRPSGWVDANRIAWVDVPTRVGDGER